MWGRPSNTASGTRMAIRYINRTTTMTVNVCSSFVLLSPLYAPVRYRSCGLVGLPNVGKSTLFNCLVEQQKQLVANFPFATIAPLTASVAARDPRLARLAAVQGSEKIVPTQVEFTDIAGLIRGASQGAGLGNQFIANIRGVSVILHVVRCFANQEIVHVESTIDPVEDWKTIEMELMLADIQVIEKRLDNVVKKAKTAPSPALTATALLLRQCLTVLNNGLPIRHMQLDDQQKADLAPLGLITEKAELVICNIDEAALSGGNEFITQIGQFLDGLNKRSAQELEKAFVKPTADWHGIRLRPVSIGHLAICAELENEIIRSFDEKARQEYFNENSITASGLDRVVSECMRLLGHQVFYTIGPKEARSWLIDRGTRAPAAAGKIHSDIERGFINAEIIKPDAFIQHGGADGAKAAGAVSIQGKAYVMEDGDIANFRFSKLHEKGK